MKSIAYIALHYGKHYLAWAIRSVQDAVDEIHILYSDKPSFGFGTKLSCPDSEEELKREANRFLTKPLFWHKGNWFGHGEHRNAIYPIAAERKADRILVVDEDEIWAPGVAHEVLEGSYRKTEKDGLGSMIHFWRSFGWVCHDACAPVRVINPHSSGGIWYLEPQREPILHFGYAQDERTTQYKIDIHSHKGEWRREWYETKFLPWRPDKNLTDVHPTNHDFWTPAPATPEEKVLVEQVLKDHPYFGKDLVQ